MKDRHEVTTPETIGKEILSEPALRPSSLDEFIGQNKVKESLKISIESAIRRKEPLDHLLIHGPPGLGKTTLASLLAKEMGVGFRATSGPILEKPADLVGPLSNQEEGDILFIDEIHRLRPVMEEYMYPAMEDFRVEIRLADGPKAQTMTMDIEKFTLVGATTRFGLLTSPMRSRFGIIQRVNFYPSEELTEIIVRSAMIMNVECSLEGAEVLAKRSRGTPRIANRLLRRVRDFALVRANGSITKKVAEDALCMLEVDEYGLDEMDDRVLRAIIEKFNGGPVGAQTLAVAISEDLSTLTDVYEPFLIQEGFLMRTPRGRLATTRAYLRCGFEPPKRDKGMGEEQLDLVD
ncbi:MAG: Holliday junction branch migration DNA helicase RuvB [Longimicrobiales bacterium]|jgi:Holliday junction DNA helicase RuvB|nr:Holliday junction branch migration DNA helicase RuvB [Longimicrobiales bacterium]|tara:strand:- start:1131 stop:2177 length:1047 start_codon:yes stop_codon:yes gene_type:complete